MFMGSPRIPREPAPTANELLIPPRADDDEDLEAGPLLPRPRQGSRPQHLLLTILGDYWYGHSETLPSRALSAVLNEFGVSYQGARAAISRLARRGLLEFSRSGGAAGYRLTRYADSVLTEGRQRILEFGADSNTWDGIWTVVIFSVPESQRELRHVVRTGLRWLGFSSLYNGTWVSPWSRGSEAAKLLAEAGVEHATILRATVPDASPERPISAWDLEVLAQEYDEFLGEFSTLLDQARTGTIGTADALRKRTLVMDAWRQFPSIDPGLPADLLPESFPRNRARAVFAELYDTLGPLAEIRLRHILGSHAPERVELVRRHATTDIRASS
jgi:phenylacetic acid degradation operon negative regulatory protein